MATYHNGFLYLSDGFGNPVELINQARTAYNLEAAAPSQIYNVAEAGGCIGLDYDPCSMDSTGAVTEWVALDLNALPWGSSAQAQDGYGFYIQEWTGLDGAHHTRTIHAQGGGHGGARFGSIYHKQRVMAFTVVLLGASERGLNHLFRWLESALLTTGGPGCLGSLWLRDFCPDGVSDAELSEGLLRADDIVLVDGPVWVTPPIADAGCLIRSLSFTLVAGNPCLFSVPTETTSATVTPAEAASVLPAYPAACSEWNGSSLRVSMAVTAPDAGSVSPVVYISAPLQVDSLGSRKLVAAQRIYATVDEAGLGSVSPCSQRNIGMIVVQNLPSGYELVVDGSDGSAQARDLHGDRVWYDGAQFIANNADVTSGYVGRRAVSIPALCSDGYFIVEPALGGNRAQLGMNVQPVSTWDIDIQAVTHVGCI